MNKQEQLYGISSEELNYILYQVIIQILKETTNNYTESTKAIMINHAQIDKRINILKQRRTGLLKPQFINMSKEDDMAINKITKAINFWENAKEN